MHVKQIIWSAGQHSLGTSQSPILRWTTYHCQPWDDHDLLLYHLINYYTIYMSLHCTLSRQVMFDARFTICFLDCLLTIDYQGF